MARETERPPTKGDELDEAPGVNVLAAGLGLNSRALTLNFVDAEDVGVCALLGLVTPDWSPAGPVGGKRTSLMGKGAGTAPIATPFRC